jgi:hypothetical protein
MRLRTALTLLTASLAAVLGAAPTASAGFFPAQAIDGPSADILQFGGIDVAADGTGALVYVKKVGGQEHIFASTLSNGAWSAPQRVDAGAALPSGSPRVAAANGGRVAIVYVGNVGGDNVLSGVVKPSSGVGYGAPTPVLDPAGGATPLLNPAIDMNVAGIAYAIVSDRTAVPQIVGARLAGGTWTPIASMNQDPTKNAADQGNGPESAIGVDGAGNGVVFFNQVDAGADRDGWLRRLTGTAIGPAIQWDVATFQGASKAAGDVNSIMLDLAVAVDGSAVAVGREDFFQGMSMRARAIGRRLTGNALGPAQAIDGLSFPLAQPDGGENPEVALAPNGVGLTAANRQLTNAVTAGRVTPSGFSPATPLFSETAAQKGGPPSVAAAANGGGLVAFHRGGVNDIVARRYSGSAFEPLATISNPAFGAASGLSNDGAMAADAIGDTAVGFVQGAAATTRIVVGGFDAPPSAPVGRSTQKPRRDNTPTLRWRAGSDPWGGIKSYRVVVDGKQMGTTSGLALTTRKLSSKTHTWSVQAVDQRGQATSSATRKLRVDRRRPTVILRFKGQRLVGKKVKVIVRARDKGGAGIKRITVKFGDRRKKSKTRRIKRSNAFAHRYRKAKRFTVTATVIDRAGNRRTVKKKLRIEQ